MASLVEAIARALVSKPEEVKVTEVSDGKNIVMINKRQTEAL